MYTINWMDKLVNLIIALIQTGIIAFIANMFVKKTYSAINNSKALSGCGICELNIDDKLYRKQMKKVFKYASSIKACYITGENLFEKEYKNIESALKRKNNLLNKFDILICRPDTKFMNNVENIEKFYGDRADSDDSLTVSSNKVIEMFNNLASDKIEIKYNESFYFFPYMIAEYKTKEGIIKEVYTNFNIPPRKSKNAVSFVARVLIKDGFECYNYDVVHSKWVLDDKDKNIVVDIEKNFDYIWEKSNGAIVKTLESDSI